MFKKIINTIVLVCLGLLLSFQSSSFKDSQLKHSRVKAAYSAKWLGLQKLLQAKNIRTDYFELYIRVFKEENTLEAWVKSKGHKNYSLLKTFPVCAASGVPGPKRRQGDGQVPEGFYEISAFQPQSSYHLALKVSYPNKSDKIKATAKDPGGDIMIHGNCATIGCVPIQDDPIEELYILAVETKNKGSVIYTDIYPFRFNEKNTARMEMTQDKNLSLFWKSLKKAYDHFEKDKSRARVQTDKKGNYTLAEN